MNSQKHINSQEWDLIETYLETKTISGQETYYSANLAEISNIEEKILHVQKIHEEIEDSIRQSKIKEFHERIPASKKLKTSKIKRLKKSNNKTLWFSMAAILVVIFGLIWMMDSKNSPEHLFAIHFKPDPGLRTVMGTKSDYNFYEGMVAYKRKEYAEAINTWQQLLAEKQDNDTLKYFLGVAFLAQGNADKSLEYLEPAKNFSQGVFKEDAAHYTALAKIKLGNIEEAKQLLKENPSERNNELLKAINN